MKGWITIAEAAKLIGCTPRHARFLALSGAIFGDKVAPRCWIVEKNSARKYAKTLQKTGRPRKCSKKSA